MREIIGFGLAAVFASVTTIPARSDAVATIDPKAAAEFVLKTCSRQWTTWRTLR
jgi:hypothetical protein